MFYLFLFFENCSLNWAIKSQILEKVTQKLVPEDLDFAFASD